MQAEKITPQYYIERGFSIIPLQANKKPAIAEWNQYKQRIMTEDEVKNYFQNGAWIGLIGGDVSNGKYFIDFDNHLNHAKETFEAFTGNIIYVKIFKDKKPIIVQTPSGGYHIYLSVQGDAPGNEKFAFEYSETGRKETLIESRGEGGYVVAPPANGYNLIQGSFDAISSLSIIQLNSLIELAKTFDKTAPEKKQTNAELTNLKTNRKNVFKKVVNEKLSWLAYHCLMEKNWSVCTKSNVYYLTRPGKNPNEGHSATFGWKGGNTFKPFSTSDEDFTENKTYTPFEVVSITKFEGNEKKCLKWIKDNFDLFPEAENYIRVGDDYFVLFDKQDQFGINVPQLKVTNKQTIIDDHSKLILPYIPKYKDFIVEPDNINYKRVINNDFYNIYYPLPHFPKEGDCSNSIEFVKHLFQDQFELGMDYIQLLYLQPKKRLPALVLVSEERETGKTTAIEWIKNIFSENCVVIESETMVSSFNMPFANKNIVCVDEAMVSRKESFEKIKKLVTQKKILVNEKYVRTFELDFFGKLIIAGNKEEDIIRIDAPETRYWVLKLAKPITDNINFAQDLVNEIPAFLYYLQNRKMKYKDAESRMHFASEKIKTNQLKVIKEESMSGLYKDIKERIIDLFENNEDALFIFGNPVDIKDEWFKTNSRIDTNYIRKTLKNDFNMTPEKQMRYRVLLKSEMQDMGDSNYEKRDIEKTGTPYKFIREDFV